MEFLDKKTIKLDKEINELDKFLFKFLDVLTKYTNYVVVSGYIPIIFGRSRSTEDIDIIVPKLDKDKLKILFNALIKEYFWCINTDKIEEAYGILVGDKLSIRFAIKKELTPNIELKFAKNKLEELVLEDNLKILIQGKKIIISPIELQIVFKEEVLSNKESKDTVGDKDIEDALHLRKLFKDKLDNNKIEKYRSLIKEYGL